ncbi:ATP-binding cassette domain-containing protein [Candidatus Liberibacter sp.]|uniref:ATP-binding cassette domain-containing protein n=1 Tax=Candidatus Liberibacter sp. TaxID=34022 RepID=UPI0015F50D5B|nr:ATP-binding cassette domain-containing protein [Candidatus Liberibacter sp.]MBA5724202.1 ATP-binding cassette domain-containing protein [Candidatus Liberibacter sp.]
MKIDNRDKQQGLNVQNISVTYSNGHRALKNVSFFIPKNTITALIGLNGAGKSTLFKAIMGFVSLGTGSISIFGQTAEDALKEGAVAYIPQADSIDWNFPILVEDVVMMGRYKHMNCLRIPSTKDYNIVTESLERVGLISVHKRQIGELSIGQRKRVFLARALAQQGKIMLLDEPFAAVDFKIEKEITALLKELRDESRLILVSTHNIQSIPVFCDQTIFLRSNIIAAGLTQDVFNTKNIQSTFNDIPHISLHEDTNDPLLNKKEI